MLSLSRVLRVVLSLILIFSLLVPILGGQVNAAPADYVKVTKTVNPSTITTEEEAEVSLRIQGTPPVDVVKPNDVILIIDKSGSMLPGNNNGEDKMKAAKEAAKGFVDLMDMSKHRVGIVDFSSESMTGTLPLTTDTTVVKNYINGIQANGSTATGYSIDKAIELLADHRTDAQPVIVIMTDGDATVGSDQVPDAYQYAINKAEEAKNAGIVFYTIALLKASDNPATSGPNILLKEMATTSSHHHFVLGSNGLEQIYAAIVQEIGIASAYDIVVTDEVSPDFEIVPGSYDHNIPKPTIQGNKLIWSFLELKNSELVFSYKIRPVNNQKTGNLPVSTSSSTVTYKDYAGANRSKVIYSPYITVKHPAPIITSIEKDYGHPAGGEVVTITGDKFRPGLSVKFGGASATNVQVISPQEITAVTPARAQGPVTVVVTNDDAQSASAPFVYRTDPIVNEIKPSHGPLIGGNLVTFNGNYFIRGIKVSFNGVPAAVNFDNPTSFYVYAPAGSQAGPVDLLLENPDGTQLLIPSGYTYDEPPKMNPEIIKLSNNSGPQAGGNFVSIDGKNFVKGLKIFFGDNEGAVTSFYSSTRIEVRVPAASNYGTVDVTVENPDGLTGTAAQAYTYLAPPPLPAPTIAKISPNQGPMSGGGYAAVDGTGFQTGVRVYLGEKEATVNRLYSEYRMEIRIPAADVHGAVDLRVVNPDEKEAVAPQAYTYLAPPPPPAPSITSIYPNVGLPAGGNVVTIVGTNIQQGAAVTFGGVLATDTVYFDTRKITVKVPSSSGYEGPVDVILTNPDNQSTLVQSGYTYSEPIPTITKINPNNGPLSGGGFVTIDGTNFDRNLIITVNGQVVPLSTYFHSGRIEFKVPASNNAGTVDVVVTNPSGHSAQTTYTYNAPPEAPAPIITKISLTYGPVSGGKYVTIDGTGFNPGMNISIGGVLVSPSRYYSSIRVEFRTPPAPGGTAGNVEIKVINPDGKESNAVLYEYR